MLWSSGWEHSPSASLEIMMRERLRDRDPGQGPAQWLGAETLDGRTVGGAGPNSAHMSRPHQGQLWGHHVTGGASDRSVSAWGCS